MFSGRLDMPNIIYVQMMFLVVIFWRGLIVVGVPFTYLIYTGQSNLLRGTDCFQPMVLLGVLILSGTLRIAFILLSEADGRKSEAVEQVGKGREEGTRFAHSIIRMTPTKSLPGLEVTKTLRHLIQDRLHGWMCGFFYHPETSSNGPRTAYMDGFVISFTTETSNESGTVFMMGGFVISFTTKPPRQLLYVQQ